MRKCGVACLALTLMAPAGQRAWADVWDTTGDDTFGGTRNELVHGADQVHDLAFRPGPVSDVDWFRLAQQPFASYEVVVDATSGDLGPSGPLVERIAADGSTVLQASVPAGAGASRSLRFENYSTGVVNDQRVRVRSGGCGTDCGSEDTYRIRFLDTTYTIARFNNSGTQVTLIVIQNTGADPVDGHIYFWSGAGLLLMSQPISIAGHGSVVFNSSGPVAGQNGSVTVSHTGAYGQLSGRATSLEPATGFTFDTPMVARPMPAQGSAGGRGSAALVITPSVADFGGVFLGGTRTVAFTVRNIGANSSGTLVTTVSGPNAAQFPVTSDTCNGSTLPAGASCGLQASFVPASAGPKSATLKVAGTPGGAATVPLSGLGVGGNAVFVTSTTHTGNLGGLAGADAICQARATAGGMPPGNYIAWLSTLTVDASSRLGAARGFVRTDGRPFADTQTGLFISQAVLNTILTDENGAVASSDDVWTGTLNTGTAAPNTCADWTSTVGNGTAGNAQGGPVSWTLYNFPACSNTLRLYCFRTDLVFPIVIPPASDRFAFLTSATFTSGGGIAAADALCASEQGGLPGTYKAYLATSTASAASRFNLAFAPYMRVDMQRVGGAAQIGTYSRLQSGIWQTVGGNYVSGTLLSNRAAWTGAGQPDAVGTPATTCSDWTSTAGTAWIGDPTLASPAWFAVASSQLCSLPCRLYCLQE